MEVDINLNMNHVEQGLRGPDAYPYIVNNCLGGCFLNTRYLTAT